MSKIANDGLTRSGTECFIAVPIRQHWASKGLRVINIRTDRWCRSFSHSQCVRATKRMSRVTTETTITHSENISAVFSQLQIRFCQWLQSLDKFKYGVAQRSV